MRPANSIVRATAQDVARLLPLFDAYRAFFAGGRDGRSSEFLEKRLERDEAVIFIARCDAETVGFITLYPLWSSWYCRRIWFLSDLYVAESARNRGMGAGLVEHVVAYAKETGASSVMVELPRREPHLKRFYAKLGFAQDDFFELARYSCM
jgi:GNAT superfamily N-acetyltransferase